MRRLILSINVTLDGCCDHTEVIADDELHRYAADLLEDTGGVLFGRVTYQLFESYWPSVAASGSGTEAEVDYARILNRKPKYVVSSTLDSVEWENSYLIRGDLAREISVLKQEDGNDLVAVGSPGLGSALVGLNAVDEYHFLVQPIVAGHGPRLFQEADQRLNLKLAGTRRFHSGVVLLRYAPVDRPPPGSG
jgi:dihydrofolate reductase